MLHALLHRLGLQTDHFLTRAQPLPSTLLVTAALCSQPISQTYRLLTQLPARSTTADSQAAPSSKAPDTKQSTGSSHVNGNPEKGSGQGPGVIEVKPAPSIAAAAVPAMGSGQGAAQGSSGFALDCSLAVHLQALRSIKQQLEGKLGKLRGGTFQEDLRQAAAAEPDSGRHMALVRSPLYSLASNKHPAKGT